MKTLISETMAPDFEPIKCECGSTKFRDVTTVMINDVECEKDRFCDGCNKLVGHWAYGKWGQ